MASIIQSIQFDRELWTPRTINIWLMKHDIQPMKKLQRYPNYYRIRLADPKLFKRFRNDKISDKGIILTIGFQ